MTIHTDQKDAAYHLRTITKFDTLFWVTLAIGIGLWLLMMAYAFDLI